MFSAYNFTQLTELTTVQSVFPIFTVASNCASLVSPPFDSLPRRQPPSVFRTQLYNSSGPAAAAPNTMSLTAREATRQHVLAVSRDFNSQPRLSKFAPSRSTRDSCPTPMCVRERDRQTIWVVHFVQILPFSHKSQRRPPPFISPWEWRNPAQNSNRLTIKGLLGRREFSLESHDTRSDPPSLCFLLVISICPNP